MSKINSKYNSREVTNFSKQVSRENSNVGGKSLIS
jgi:hypothetical protein